jgi:hypothetical protein
MKQKREKKITQPIAFMIFYFLGIIIFILDQSSAATQAEEKVNTYTQMNQVQSPLQQAVKTVTLIYPNGGERFELGKTFVIQWQSKLMPYLMIRLRNTDRNFFYDIGKVPASSGSYQWRIPHDAFARNAVDLTAGNYKLIVQDPTGNPHDESDSLIQIQLPVIDLECRYAGMRYGAIPGMDKIFKIQMRNNGTRVLQDVLFNWVIKKNGAMTAQDGAGYGQVYPNTVYEYEIPLRKHSDEDWRDYTIDFYIDPQNRQNEDSALRDDNQLSISGQRL